MLDGGIAAWEAAGFRVYSGVHVPSKAFAEVVEHEAGTPWISAEDLKALIDSGADIAIFDSRSFEEYHNNSIPTAISVPGAELVYRFADLVPSSDTTVIVNCGGRTRSIIGAQALRNAGVRNRIMSLKDGTMAWHLAGFDVVQGATRRPPEVSAHRARRAGDAAARVAERCGIARIDKATLAAWRAEADRRTLYVLDVRTPEEYEAGHLRGARLGAGRTARAGDRRAYRHLERARRAGRRQRRASDDDRILAEADGLEARWRCWSPIGRLATGRAARMCRASSGSRTRAPRHRGRRTCATDWPPATW